MVKADYENAAPQALDILGISESEERVYRWLIDHPGTTAQDLVQVLSVSSYKVHQLLNKIEAQGLATHAPERPRRYYASAPDVALGALFHQQQKTLLGAQLTIQNLQERANFAQHDNQHKQMVELITSREAEQQILDQMERTVEHEFITLMRRPMRVTQYDVPADEYNTAQREAQARGILYRTVVDSELMELSGYPEGIRSDMQAGEQVRVIPNLPLKLVLIDRKVALIPLNLQRLESPSLLVRSSTLLEALYELFEMFWERAMPVSFAQKGETQISADEPDLSEEIKGLISLLSAGLNDKTIAYDLNISKRTFERRIAELMRLLNARTRFQVGWIAAQHLADSMDSADKRG